MKMKTVCAFVVLFSLQSLFVFADSGESSVQKLDQSIKEVIAKREYQWRLPRAAPPLKQENFLIRFLESWMNAFNRFWKPIGRWIGKVYEWLRKALLSLNRSSSGGRALTKNEFNTWIIGLIVALSLLLIFFIWRVRKRKKHLPPVVQATAVQPEPDLSDENLVADQFLKEGWQKLAEDLVARGDFRLAMRAFFMATLAHLAETQWIKIAKFKSNRDYWVELQRRAHDRMEMQDAFYINVTTVDRVWYGMHPVSADMLQQFRENVEIVKQAAA